MSAFSKLGPAARWAAACLKIALVGATLKPLFLAVHSAMPEPTVGVYFLPTERHWVMTTPLRLAMFIDVQNSHR